MTEWVVNRAAKIVLGENVNFPQKVMVWLGVCSKGVSPLVIFESHTLDHDRYIKEVLPVTLKYGNNVFGNDWTFEQDGAKAHIHKKSQE